MRKRIKTENGTLTVFTALPFLIRLWRWLSDATGMWRMFDFSLRYHNTKFLSKLNFLCTSVRWIRIKILSWVFAIFSFEKHTSEDCTFINCGIQREFPVDERWMKIVWVFWRTMIDDCGQCRWYWRANLNDKFNRYANFVSFESTNTMLLICCAVVDDLISMRTSKSSFWFAMWNNPIAHRIEKRELPN